MASFKEEIGKRKPVFLVIFLAHGMLNLVNSLEGSFARTLITCSSDASLEASGPWSGSPHCSDRVKVLNEGTALSSWANSLENIAKLLMMIGAAVLSDVYGRKPVMLVGLGCTTLSALFFVVATLIGGDWARLLFIGGQGLQGVFPDKLLCGLIISDLASLSDTHSVSVFEAESQIVSLSDLVFTLVAFALQVCDPANYLPIWIVAFAINMATFLVAFRDCPETRQFKEGTGKGGIVKNVLGELQAYYDLLMNVKGMKVMVLSFAFASMADYKVVATPMLMAYHKMTLSRVILLFLPLFVIQPVCMPFVGYMRKKFGYKDAFLKLVYMKFSTVIWSFLVPAHWGALYVLVYFQSGLLAGYNGFLKATESHVWGDRTSKYTVLINMGGFIINVVMGPLYSSLYDAGAQSYFEKVRPCLFSIFLTGLQFVVLFSSSLWATYDKHLNQMEVEDAKKEKEDSDAKKKKADEGKTD